MKLTLAVGDDRRAVMHVDRDPEKLITVRSVDAVPIAREIVQAVNRDYLFTALVLALTPFKSDQMGTMIVNVLQNVDNPIAQEAMENLNKLIKAIDRILEAAEREKARQ